MEALGWAIFLMIGPAGYKESRKALSECFSIILCFLGDGLKTSREHRSTAFLKPSMRSAPTRAWGMELFTSAFAALLVERCLDRNFEWFEEIHRLV
jgi:hypothetical protein